jgi:hypothetical protein
MTTNHINTGHRRLCPHCKRSISTTHHKFDRHTVPGSDNIICSGSGQPVEKQKTDQAQADLFGVLD